MTAAEKILHCVSAEQKKREIYLAGRLRTIIL